MNDHVPPVLDVVDQDWALGKVNRYYCWKNTGREASSDEELISYYLQNNPKFKKEEPPLGPWTTHH